MDGRGIFQVGMSLARIRIGSGNGVTSDGIPLENIEISYRVSDRFFIFQSTFMFFTPVNDIGVGGWANERLVNINDIIKIFRYIYTDIPQ